MDKVVKFALIGCGRISVNHTDAINKAPHAKLVAVCDIIEERAKAVAQENGLDKWYTDIEDMINQEEIDVCCILTPSGLHAQCAEIVANHKINVLCEKPLDITKENMERMIAACEKNGVKLGGIFQRRTFDAAIAVKKRIENGGFGKVTMGSAYLRYFRDQEYYDSGEWRGTWELDGGGAFMNQGVHGVDMLDWIMGGIHSVTAICKTLAWDIDVEDTAVVIVKFKNGALGTIECCTSAYPGLDTLFTISGTEGDVSFGDGGIYKWNMKNGDEKPETFGNMGGLNCAYNTDNYGHIMQIEDMALAVINDTEPMVTAQDAKHSVNIINAIYESARTGKEIIVD